MQMLSQGPSAWAVGVVLLAGVFWTPWQPDATAAFLPGEFITYSNSTFNGNWGGEALVTDDTSRETG